MINGDRDIGGRAEEQEKPCHFLFDMAVKNPVVGYTAAFSLQAETRDQVPEVATNIRPVKEGDIVGTTYDLRDPRNPKPVNIVHSHSDESERSCFGFHWGGQERVPMEPTEAEVYKKEHPIIED